MNWWTNAQDNLFGIQNSGLSEEEQRRLRQQAGMNAGLALLAGSGYSATPRTLGEVLAQGTIAGRQAGAAGMEEAKRRAQEQQRLAFIAQLPPEQQRLYQLFGNDGLKMGIEQQNKLAQIDAEARNRQPKDTRTPAQKNAEALGYAPGSPAYKAYVNQVTTMNREPVVNINNGDATGPFGKKGQELSAERYFTMQDQAAGAIRGVQAIDALESIFSAQETGKLKEASAQLGQWLGTGGGADLQASQAIVMDRVNEILNAAKGPQTDKDAERAIAQIPNIGTDPRARKVVFDYIRRKASATIQDYHAATKFANENRGLVGFIPPSGRDFDVGAPSAINPRFSGSGGGQLPMPQTLDEFNALPSGAEYIDPDDGRRYKKR